MKKKIKRVLYSKKHNARESGKKKGGVSGKARRPGAMLRFQALTWYLEERRPGYGSSGRDESADARAFRDAALLVHVCGRTAAGGSVHVVVVDHAPVFYTNLDEDAFMRVAKTATLFGKAFQDWWVRHIERVRRRVYQGFMMGADIPVLKVTAAAPGVSRALTSAIVKNGGRLYDSQIDPVTSLFHRTGLRPCGWIEVTGGLGGVPAALYEPSMCDHDELVRVHDLRPIASTDVAPFLVMSMDIEAVAPVSADGSYPFPDPKIRSHKISCICARMRWASCSPGTDDIDDVYFAYSDVDVNVIRGIADEEGLLVSGASAAHANERDMLNAFVQFFRSRAPDIVTGWNTLNFDMHYIFERCALYGVSLSGMGKFEMWRPKLRTGSFSTRGKEFRYWTIAGVLQLDMLEWALGETSLRLASYTLDHVSEHLLGLNKRDMPPYEIHRKSQGTAADLGEVVGYCLKDALLPDEIGRNLHVYVKILMFANIAMVPPDYYVTRGASVKTYSLIANEVAQHGWLICDSDRTFNHIDGKYTGATVLDADAGLHEDPVATLDFKSLYPSIIRAMRLDHQAFVEDPAFLGIPGVQYKTYAWIDEKTAQSYRFVIVTNGEEIGCPALIPGIMERLGMERDAAKRRLKSEANPATRVVHDATQLAIKLMMNAIYGFLGGVKASKLAHLPLAMLTTKVGRDIIHETQRYVLARYGAYEDDSTLESRLREPIAQLESRCAGVRNVYGDTDSVFIKWTVPDHIKSAGERAVMEYTFKVSEDAAAHITEYLNETMCSRKGAVELEFEKVYYWLIMYSKKQYAGLMWTKVDKYDKIDFKGIQVVRKGQTLFLRNLLESTLKKFLVERDKAGCAALVHERLRDLVEGRVPLTDLQLRAKLKTDGYDGSMPAHAVVAQKMRSRGLSVPDRVPFVFIVASGKMQGDRAEDPAWVAENGLQVDIAHYITNQISKPVMDRLGLIVPDLASGRGWERYIDAARRAQRPAQDAAERAERPAIAAAERLRLGMPSIEKYFGARATVATDVRLPDTSLKRDAGQSVMAGPTGGDGTSDGVDREYRVKRMRDLRDFFGRR